MGEKVSMSVETWKAGFMTDLVGGRLPLADQRVIWRNGEKLTIPRSESSDGQLARGRHISTRFGDRHGRTEQRRDFWQISQMTGDVWLISWMWTDSPFVGLCCSPIFSPQNYFRLLERRVWARRPVLIRVQQQTKDAARLDFPCCWLHKPPISCSDDPLQSSCALSSILAGSRTSYFGASLMPRYLTKCCLCEWAELRWFSANWRAKLPREWQKGAKTLDELAAVLFNLESLAIFSICRLSMWIRPLAWCPARRNTTPDGAGLARMRSDLSFRSLASGWDWR